MLTEAGIHFDVVDMFTLLYTQQLRLWWSIGEISFALPPILLLLLFFVRWCCCRKKKLKCKSWMFIFAQETQRKRLAQCKLVRARCLWFLFFDIFELLQLPLPLSCDADFALESNEHWSMCACLFACVCVCARGRERNRIIRVVSWRAQGFCCIQSCFYISLHCTFDFKVKLKRTNKEDIYGKIQIVSQFYLFSSIKISYDRRDNCLAHSSSLSKVSILSK